MQTLDFDSPMELIDEILLTKVRYLCTMVESYQGDTELLERMKTTADDIVKYLVKQKQENK